MCGIFCSIINSEHECKGAAPNLCTCSEILFSCYEELLKHRGPDTQNVISISYNSTKIFFAATVLWLQGKEPVMQPKYLNGSYLLFNGDIYGGTLIENNVKLEKGDTEPLLQELVASNSISEVLKKIHGPFSLIFYNKQKNVIYFCRDPFGRKSLLIGHNNGQFVISSVTNRKSNISLIELPAGGIYSIDMTNTSYNIKFEPWFLNKKIYETQSIIKQQLNIDVQIIKTTPVRTEDTFHCRLHENNTLIPVDNSNPESILIQYLNKWQKNISELHKRLQESVDVRVNTQPQIYKKNLGILFSGGIDCSILAALANKSLHQDGTIYLYNVAFQMKDNTYETPDRITAKQSIAELKCLYPERKWILEELNITKEELHLECSRHIADLIYPLTTILDESLGCAFWFASRGAQNEIPFRVLLIGTGADELFGGYTRHRAVFRRGGWDALSNELFNDWLNLPYRNLSRDDRVIADHGKQARMPYLDENVVELALSLPVWEKCYPTKDLSNGIGDKLLLRLLAYKLGLKKTSLFPKRAIQFGSRIANSKENAKDISPRLQLQITNC